MHHAYRLHRWQSNKRCRPVQVMLTTFLFQIFHAHLGPNQMPSQIFRACWTRSSVWLGLHAVYNAILLAPDASHKAFGSYTTTFLRFEELLSTTFCACLSHFDWRGSVAPEIPESSCNCLSSPMFKTPIWANVIRVISV